MKKICTMLLAFSLLLGIHTAAFASVSASDPAISEKTRELAYMDLEKAPEDMKEKILEARRVIIYSESWVADGYASAVVDAKTGEVIRETPQFSELFPDWDLPVEKPTGKEVDPPSILGESIPPKVPVPGKDMLIPYLPYPNGIDIPATFLLADGVFPLPALSPSVLIAPFRPLNLK